MAKKKDTRPVVGFYGLTGCYGCLLSAIFNEDEILDLVEHVKINSFPFIKEKDDRSEMFDVIFLEGTVVSEGNLEELKELRERCRLLVALGACSCTGGIAAVRNFVPEYKLEGLKFDKREDIIDVKASPIDAHVQVDYYLPGCPPSKKEVLDFIKGLLNGKINIPNDNPVCVECKMNGNKCLLVEEGKMCFGPVTRGGCDSVCTKAGLECWGCRGPTKDANEHLMVAILENKGHDPEVVRERLETFIGMKVANPGETKKWLK